MYLWCNNCYVDFKSLIIPMRTVIFFSFLSFFLTSLNAQIENSTKGFPIESSENNFETPEDLKLPTIKKPSFNINEDNKKFTDLGEAENELLNMNMEDGLLENKTGSAPKYFTKDKALTEEIGGDQYLGDFKTSSGFVNVQYRDHQYVDGDLIRVFVNDDIVQSGIYLSGSFRGFNLPLESGFNRIDFLALNQGSSGPNTAELHVYDDAGRLVSAYEWNLLTGDKATVVIVKE